MSITPFRKKSRVGSVRTVARNTFLRLSELTYDDDGVQRTWELAQRNSVEKNEYEPSSRSFSVDAVDIRVIVQSRQAPDRIVLVVQYRPPLDAYCVEFPAGLIDAGESPVHAALRELREETGYVGTESSCHVSPVIAYEPGLSDSCFHLVTINIDENDPENHNPSPQQEDSEDIRVFLVSHGRDMLQDVERIQQTLASSDNGGESLRTIVDAKVYTYALALQSMAPS